MRSTWTFQYNHCKCMKMIQCRYGSIDHSKLWVLSNDNGIILSEAIFPNNGETQSLRDGILSNQKTGTTATKRICITTRYVGDESCNNLSMQGMTAYKDDINKIYGIIVATTSINLGSNVDFLMIATDYNGDISCYNRYYAFNHSNLNNTQSHHVYQHHYLLTANISYVKQNTITSKV